MDMELVGGSMLNEDTVCSSSVRLRLFCCLSRSAVSVDVTAYGVLLELVAAVKLLLEIIYVCVDSLSSSDLVPEQSISSRASEAACC